MNNADLKFCDPGHKLSGNEFLHFLPVVNDQGRAVHFNQAFALEICKQPRNRFP